MLRSYLAKLGANAVALLTGAAHLALVPRILGPESYGHYVFLSNFFQQMTAFLDLGTSTGFYVKLSQRQDDWGLVRFYLWIVAASSLFMLAAVALLAQTSLGNQIWGDQAMRYVMLAALLGCLTWWHQIASKVIDGYGLTVKGELFGIANRIFMLFVLVVIAYAGVLSLGTYLTLQIVTFAIGVAILCILARAFAQGRRISRASPTIQYAKEIWKYSHPLVTYTVVGAITWMLERWLLQTQAGASEQGYYGLAYQIGAICFLFTNALSQLLMREFAIAWDSGDRDGMARLFSRCVPLFYTLASVFSIFVACRAHDITWLVGGSEYVEGLWAVTIMALYPMHQTYGQLSGSLFYATGHTRRYRDITIVGMLCGLGLAYWLIVPATMGGLGLGAAGLAVKMVVIQLIVVNVMLWFNTRLLAVSFGRFVINQVKVPAVLLFILGVLMSIEASVSMPRLAGLLLTGVGYLLITCIVMLKFPMVFDVHEEDVRRLRNSLTAFAARNQERRSH